MHGNLLNDSDVSVDRYDGVSGIPGSMSNPRLPCLPLNISEFTIKPGNPNFHPYFDRGRDYNNYTLNALYR